MKIIIPFLLIIFSLGILLQSCTPSQANPDEGMQAVEKAVSVKIEAIEATSDPLPIHTSGIVGSEEMTKLSFKLGGLIQSIKVDEGNYVKKGQVLATLNPAEINAQVKQAQEGLAKAERDLERVNKLYQDTVATYENVQDLTTARDVAQSNLEIALFNQEHAVIKAPANGKILKRLAETGEMTGPGTPILVMDSNGGVPVFKAGLTSAEIVKIRIGDRAAILLDAYPDQPMEAYVANIAETAHPQTGLFETEFSIKTSGKALRNGFMGKIDLFPGRQAPYYPIPIDAMVDGDQDEVIVFVPTDENTAKRIALSPYQIHNDFLAVPVAGNPEIRKVITLGAKYLKDGGSILLSK